MLLNKRVLEGITEGRISLAFRKWKRPTVKTGGKLKTRIGVLSIDSVEQIVVSKITSSDAKKAGFESRSELLKELASRDGGTIYRIAFHFFGEDPRIKLRQQSKLTLDEIKQLKQTLQQKDARSKRPWTTAIMKLIAENPGRRAPDLAIEMEMDTPPFKANVRKLKELGLTESLKVGYRLSPRGKALFKKL
jgi:hypothetical protein